MMKDRILYTLSRTTVKRSLRVADLMAFGYGDLGSSIYYALGITAIHALSATPLALLIAGAIFLLTALTYAELASMIPDAGGSASYTRKTFNDLISFMAGWALLLDYIVTIAISSFAIGPYLKYFLPAIIDKGFHLAFTMGMMIILFLLNGFGTHFSARVSRWIAAATILTQAIIIIAVVTTLFHWRTFYQSFEINTAVDGSPSWSEFFKGIAMAMVAYTGIESMAQLGKETKKPAKTVPQAMMIVTAILIISYFGLSMSALSVMSAKELSTTFLSDPITGMTQRIPGIGPYVSGWIALLGAIILFSAANSGLIGASRVAFNLGEYCQLPRFFYRCHPRFQTPVTSLAVFALAAATIILWSEGNLSFMADLYNFGAQIAFFSAHLALIKHRIRFPNIKRPFKTPLNITIAGRSIPMTAVIGALLNIAVWITVILTKKEGRELGLIWLVIGLGVYVILRRHYRLPMIGSVKIKKVPTDHSTLLKMKKILVPVEHGEIETVHIAASMAQKNHAKLVLVRIQEVPESLPLEGLLLEDSLDEKKFLARVEAVAFEYHVPFEMRQVTARSLAQAVIEIAHEEQFDLIILGSSFPCRIATKSILTNAACRVWICKKDERQFLENRNF